MVVYQTLLNRFEIIPEFENNDEAFLDLLPDALGDAGKITLKKLEGRYERTMVFFSACNKYALPCQKA